MKVLLAVLMFGRFLKEIYAAGSTIELDPSQLYIKQGDEALLQCMYESAMLVWDARRKIGNLTWAIIANGQNTINKTKYNVSAKSGSMNYSKLHVLNTQPSDELIYRCNAGLHKVNFFQLNLYVKPSSLYFNESIDNKIEGREGTNLLIRCIAVGGKPPPDVSILDGNNLSNTQEVSYTIPMISRDYHQKSIVCQATSAALDNTMTTTVQIILSLKSLTPIFNKNQVSTEEAVPLRVFCTSYGSRPAATLTWTIGERDVTSSSTSQPVRESNDTYTVTSTLIFSVNRSHNNQSIICQASNAMGSVSASKTLDVKYAPDISVNSPNYTQNDAIRKVTCNPSGNPANYTYHKWQHKSRYGKIIKEFNGSKTLTLLDATVLLRYQDTGEYVCIASNGIRDRYNHFEQSGFGFVTVNAMPVFTYDTNNSIKQFGEIDKAVDIYVNVYSVPKFTSFVWTHKGTPITTQNSAKYQLSSSSTIVQDKFHGKEVQLDGYNVTLTIRDLKVEDFVYYTVTLKSGFPDVKFTIVLESATVPETPGNFSKISSSTSSIYVQWDPNFGGGYKQTFYIQYRVQGSTEWTIVSAGEEDINEQRRRRTYEVTNLKEGKAYELRMYAENTAMKRSNFTEVLIELTESSDAGFSTGAIIGGVAGSLIAIIIVLLVIVRVLKKRKDSATPSTKLRTSSESEDDGLKDNILYEPSQSDGLKKNVLYQSAGPDFESRNKTSTSSEYAVVQKPNAIYAEVNKVAQPKKAKAKKQKDQKEKPKKDRKVKAKAVNNNPEEEYANSALPLQHLNDGEYANSADTQGSSGLNTNAQGLEYADLTFRQSPTKDKKQVIHGNDERTLYADVDHTKKAPPPPQESEYEETNIKHGKIN